MKRFTFFTFILAVTLLVACTTSGLPQDKASKTEANLVISGGEIHKSYVRADLEALPVSQAVFKEVTYKGVTLSALLQDAGFDLSKIKAIKAVAQDGFTVNYDPAQVLVNDVIVAYARADGELAAEDGAFRMVVPGTDGKLNVRMLVELQIIQ